MGFASYVDDCQVGYDDDELTSKYIGQITKSEDMKTFDYSATIAQILDTIGFKAMCMVKGL